MHRSNADQPSATFLVLLPDLVVLIQLHLGELHRVGFSLPARDFVPLIDLLDQVSEGLVDVLARQRAHCEELAVVLGL